MTSAAPRPAFNTLGALALVVALLIGLAAIPRMFVAPEGRLVGKRAPDFSLGLVANAAALGRGTSTFNLADVRGRAVLLDFWATWCGPCRAQAPIVEQVARRWRDRDVVVVGVNTDAPGEGDPGAYAAGHGLSYPIVRDTSGQASRLYAVESLPTLIVISRAGTVTAVRTGITDDAELERLLRQAL